MSLTSIIFLIAFSAGLIFSLLRHPAFGLYTYIAVFYLHPPDRWWGAVLPDLRWSLLAAFVTLLSLWRLEPIPDRPGFLKNNVARFFLLLVIWFWIQSLWALDAELNLEFATLYTKYLLLVYLMYAVIQTEEIFRNVLIVHVLGCLFLSLIVFFAADSGRYDGRFDGVGGPGIDDANALAMQLSTGLLAASALVLQGSLRIRAVGIAAAPFVVNGIIQTLSRGPVVGLIAGGVAILLLAPVRFRRICYALGVLSCLILLQMAPAAFWERIGSISEPFRSDKIELDMSTQTRLALITAQVQMTLDYPFGSGHRGTADLSPRYLGEEHMAYETLTGEALGQRSSHNTFMTVLAEHGVVGAILFLGLLVSAYRQLRRLKPLDLQGLQENLGVYRAAIGGSLASVLVAGLFTDFIKAEVFIWLLGLLIVLCDLAPRSVTAPEPGGQPDAPPATAVSGNSKRPGPRRLGTRHPARTRQ